MEIDMLGTLYQSSTDGKSFIVHEVKLLHEGQAVTDTTDLSFTDRELQNGDLLTVFNSAEQGEELFKVTIDLEMGKEDYQYSQNGVDKKLWYTAFFNHLPAKLQKKEGAEIDGILEPFTEQGMEGHIAWSVFDFKANSYASLHALENGDILTVFTGVTQGNKEWEGRVEVKDEPFATGKDIMVVSFDPDDANLQSFRSAVVPEVTKKTHIAPPLASLEHWAMHHRPVQVLH